MVKKLTFSATEGYSIQFDKKKYVDGVLSSFVLCRSVTFVLSCKYYKPALIFYWKINYYKSSILEFSIFIL